MVNTNIYLNVTTNKRDVKEQRGGGLRRISKHNKLYVSHFVLHIICILLLQHQQNKLTFYNT